MRRRREGHGAAAAPFPTRTRILARSTHYHGPLHDKQIHHRRRSASQ